MQLEEELIRIKDEVSEYLLPKYPRIFKEVIERLAFPFKGKGITVVVGLEAKGFIFGPIIAERLGLPFVPILKSGKLKTRPEFEVLSRTFIDWTGLKKSIEIMKISLSPEDKVLLVDDWFESGNTGRAAIEMIEELGAKVSGISVIFNQLSPEDEEFYKQYHLHYIVRLEPE